jgi:hypothetical protein
MAENVVVPMLVIHMLQAHVTNFHNEMDQYLAVLAVNKGSLASSEIFVARHALERNNYAMPERVLGNV